MQFARIALLQRAEPNQHITDVDGGQRCRLDLPEFVGELPVNGTAGFTLDDPTALNATLMVDGEHGPADRPGHTRVVVTYTFDGRRGAP